MVRLVLAAVVVVFSLGTMIICIMGLLLVVEFGIGIRMSWFIVHRICFDIFVSFRVRGYVFGSPVVAPLGWFWYW